MRARSLSKAGLAIRHLPALRVVFGLAVMLPAALQAPMGGPPPQHAGSGADPHELIVSFASGTQANVKRATHQAYGNYRRMRSRTNGWEVVVLPPYADRERIRQKYIDDPHVEHVERNRTVLRVGAAGSAKNGEGSYSTAANDSDWLHDEQWGLERIGMPQVWEQMGEDGSADDVGDAGDIVVAVLDTGIDRNHPDLEDNIWQNPSAEECSDDYETDDDGNILPCDDDFGWDFTFDGSDGDKSGQPYDDNGHGTHVAGIIGAHGGHNGGVSGVARTIQLMALKFLDSSGSGNVADAIRAIEDYVLEHNVDVINASYVSTVSSTNQDRLPTDCADLTNHDGKLECEAIAAAGEQGVLVVAAAGNNERNNDNPSEMTLPASLPLVNVISVAASAKEQDRLTSFTNYGRLTTHLAAPGKGIYSTYLDDGYKRLDGTSMAAPMVSGLAALLMQRHNAEQGEPQTDQERQERMLQVREQILGTVACNEELADELGHECYGGELKGGKENARDYAERTLLGGRLDAWSAWSAEEGNLAQMRAVPPSHLSVSDNDASGGAELYWLGSSPTTDRYSIKRRYSDEDEFTEIAKVEASIGAHSFADNEPQKPGTLYRVANVQAYPPDPVLASAEAKNDSVSLRWYEYPMTEQGCYELRRHGADGTELWQVAREHKTYTDKPGRGDFSYSVRACLDCTNEREGEKNCSNWSNEKQVSVVGSGTAELVESFEGFDNADSDSRCFIATAAYGSPYAAEVESLREFRDAVLIQHGLGRALVSAYYRVSPPLAAWVAESDTLKAWVRGVLDLFYTFRQTGERRLPAVAEANVDQGVIGLQSETVLPGLGLIMHDTQIQACSPIFCDVDVDGPGVGYAPGIGPR
ncbi:serine protease [Halorhodospira halochloris]|uniref:Serine protease n=2 Tax=Halorhodospira halochloris TaxID=1052 RepID=A0A0X8XB64_HALHR|nr:S8 family peptidase [Halorhodospira halochloris]MBK1650880.1 hypothetical protein [Halorhodospira halochloris]BAU56619.1 serine protease [Halorhodospira halochloris]